MSPLIAVKSAIAVDGAAESASSVAAPVTTEFASITGASLLPVMVMVTVTVSVANCGSVTVATKLSVTV